MLHICWVTSLKCNEALNMKIIILEQAFVMYAKLPYDDII